MVMAKPFDRIEVVVHITGVPPSTATELTSPIPVTPIGQEWNTVDVSSSNIVVSGDFYVAIEQPLVTVAHDSSSSNFEGRSVYGDSLDTMTNLCCNDAGLHNFMIRAEIDPIAPVGGIVIPANNFAIVAPWLAVIGLVGCIGTAVVVAKKRRA